MGKSLIDFPLSKYTPIKSDVSASPAFFGWLMLQLALHVCYHEQYCQKGSISVCERLHTYPSPSPTTVHWQQGKVNVG